MARATLAAIPSTTPSRCAHSPVCRPALATTPACASSVITAPAPRIARAGPSNVISHADSLDPDHCPRWRAAIGRIRLSTRPAVSRLCSPTFHAEYRPEGAFLAADAAERLDETLDHGDNFVLIADKRQVIAAGQLDEAGAGDPRGQVAAFLDQQTAIAGPVQHERRHADQRQYLADAWSLMRPDAGRNSLNG